MQRENGVWVQNDNFMKKNIHDPFEIFVLNSVGEMFSLKKKKINLEVVVRNYDFNLKMKP